MCNFYILFIHFKFAVYCVKMVFCKYVQKCQFILPLNIEARYPTQKEEIFELLNENVCKDILKRTEEMIEWIRNKLDN